MNDFLSSFSSSDNSKFTHYRFFPTRGKLCIPPESCQAFWQLYCNSDDDLYIAEKNTEYMPILLQLDLKFDQEEAFEHKPYGEKFLAKLVSIVQENIRSYYNVSTHVACCVLESEAVDRTHYVLYRILLQFPFCYVEALSQADLLTKVIECLRDEAVISVPYLSYLPTDRWEDIFSKDIVFRPLPMYRSRSEVDVSLILTHIWGEIDEERVRSLDFQEEQVIPEIPLSSVLIPTNHSHYQSGLIDDEFLAQTPKEKLLPLLLSLSYWKTISPLKKKSPKASLFDNEPQQILQTLLPMINKNRADTSDWEEIGKAIYNTYSGSELGLQTWISFLHSFEDVEERSFRCFQIYPKFDKSNHLTYKTVAWFARIDSPQNYAEWHKDYCYAYLEKALSRTEHDVAVALHKTYFLDYVCASLKHRTWYAFRGAIWIASDSGVDLRSKISNEFVTRFESFRAKLSEAITQVPKDEKERFERLIEKTGKLIVKLGTKGFKDAIFSEAAEMFYDEKFEQIKDHNVRLMGILEGVIQLTNDKAVWRPGKPEDFMTKYSAIKYNDKYSLLHPDVKRVWRYLKQVYPDKELLHYVLKLFSSFLYGGNPDKLFIIYSGSGDNSKSMVKKLLDFVFGPYLVDIPTSLFTGKQTASSNASPEVAQAKNSRVLVMQEPSDDETMSNGTIKKFTGGDSFFARFLHDNGGKVQTTFKVVLICNNIPMIPYSDKATRNRLRVIPHMSTWVDNPPDSIEERKRLHLFQKDEHFDQQLEGMASAFLWLLVHYYPIYLKEKVHPPKLVREHTEQYWRDNDIYGNFITDRYERVQDAEGMPSKTHTMPVAEVCKEFNYWFSEFHTGLKVPQRKTIIDEFSRRWGEPVDSHYLGIQPKVQVKEEKGSFF
ncbi:VV D5-like helicase [Pithovirus sibericum]|uniref:VV D5-like helicase n=1 Tax=Pithovirus sibericum TaxID=1450746 RepID=W5S4D4_9VIRU|nr:VV D5-like helicase [Pithovirus sibericum]AHH01581.1 VV D5-like helicase [Pithovirus sibericum]WIL05139.1 D5-like helicase [Pithovirus mammoth]